MRSFLRHHFAPKLQSLNTITISGSTLLANLAHLQSLHPADGIFPVLKSNAYGHGLKQVSTILKDTTVPYICVDSFPEYQIVKKYAQKKSLILGETRPENYAAYDPRRATLCIYNIETLKTLIQTGKRRTIHLFLNTGMNREGIGEADLHDFLELLGTAKHITLEGVMSHFANADEIDSSFDQLQIDRFKKMYQTIVSSLKNPEHIRYRHISNSAGILKHHDPFFNAHRAGLAFYGYNPLSHADTQYHQGATLTPALEIFSTVTAVQHLTAGEIVSYGGKRQAKKSMSTATIPFGYYEGLSRSLTNGRSVQRKNQTLPSIGTICMNLSCLDTLENNVQLGDQVTIISSNSQDPNTIETYAKKIGTIPYEILVKLNEKIRRTIV